MKSILNYNHILCIIVSLAILGSGCIKTNNPSPSGSSSTTTTSNGSVTTSNGSNTSNWSLNGVSYNVTSGYPTSISFSNIYELWAEGKSTTGTYGTSSFLYFYFGSNQPGSGSYTIYSGSSSSVPSGSVYVSLIQSTDNSDNYTGAFTATTGTGVVTVTKSGNSISASFSNIKFKGTSSYKTSSGGTVYNGADSVSVVANVNL